MLPPTQILNKVPEINRTVIQSVLAFLRDMAKHSDKTKMGAANLAWFVFLRFVSVATTVLLTTRLGFRARVSKVRRSAEIVA